MNLQQVVLSLGVFTTLLRDRCYGDEDTEHVHIKLHVPEIINRLVHVKTKYMHVYHPKKVVQEMPPTFVDQQPMDHHAGMWMPSSALPSGMVSSPSAALSSASSSAMAAAAAASLSSMVQDKLSTQLAQELMMRYRNLETPAVGGSNDLRESVDHSDYLRDYYRQQRKLSDQLMLQEAMQLPNFAQTKYLSNMGYNWDKSFGVKSGDTDQSSLLVKKSKKKKAYGHLVVQSVESAIAGDRLVFHVPINYKNVHMTKTRVKPVHHRTYQKTDYKLLGYSMDKHAPQMESMSPMEYLAKMQILRG
uniref:Uncharacterized protein n=1 Tax=Anopheles christyi TaxID=43041 RepID=A0A182KH85_9DIPT